MLSRLLHWLFDRHRGRGTMSAPLDEVPPPVRNWADAVAESRSRRMDEPIRDEGGMGWSDEPD